GPPPPSRAAPACRRPGRAPSAAPPGGRHAPSPRARTGPRPARRGRPRRRNGPAPAFGAPVPAATAAPTARPLRDPWPASLVLLLGLTRRRGGSGLRRRLVAP